MILSENSLSYGWLMLHKTKQQGDSMADKYKIQTKKGYDFFQVSSAMQKCIRRNLEDEALYWGYELFQSGYENYMWKRLLIITTEDVGLGEPNAPAHINGLYQIYLDLKKRKDNSTILCVIQAIIYLCRAEKSRLIDWAKIAYINSHNTRNLEIPDFALDIHTRKGKQMGRTVKDFYDTGSKLSPHKILDREEELKQIGYNWDCNMTKEERKKVSTFTEVEGKIQPKPKEPKEETLFEC